MKAPASEPIAPGAKPGLILVWLMAALLGMGAARPALAQEDGGESPVLVRLALQWQPQSQFAGYYMARERGFYRDRGLEVEWLHADGERGSLRLLREGQADLATAFLSDGLSAALPASAPAGTELTLVQVAQLVQGSNLMLVAWRDMGVERAEDLDGARVSHWTGGFSSAFDAFFAAHRIEPVRVPQYASVSLFLKRGVAACAAMHYNEYHRILQAGVDPERLTTFHMGEQGFGFAEDGLYATAAWVAAHPERALAIRAATLKGWEYARDHPEETLDVVMAESRRSGVSTNRPQQAWMLGHVLDDVFPPGIPRERAGWLDPADFVRAAQALVDTGRLARPPALAEFAPIDASLTP